MTVNSRAIIKFNRISNKCVVTAPVTKLNVHLDNFVRPHISLRGKYVSAYKVFGYTGFMLAVLYSAILSVFISCSVVVIGGLALTSAVTFLTLVMVTKIIIGDERIIYYHHEIAIIMSTFGFLHLINQPVLQYIDLTVIGIGVFLAVGRVGCLMVGCCHGRPHGWGVRYRNEHADAGFTRHYVGVRLFPIQAVEALWVIGVVIVASIIVISGDIPGEAFSWYIVSYGIGRFLFEFMRGDTLRPYFWRFSEAQWITIILMGIISWKEFSGELPFHSWHIAASGSLALYIIVTGFYRRHRSDEKFKILHPLHLKEIADAIGSLSRVRVNGGYNSHRSSNYLKVRPKCTSQGIQISGTHTIINRFLVRHYTISSSYESLTKNNASAIADLISKLQHSNGSGKLIEGRHGMYHILLTNSIEEHES
jgi:hypothetical protein